METPVFVGRHRILLIYLNSLSVTTCLLCVSFANPCSAGLLCVGGVD